MAITQSIVIQPVTSDDVSKLQHISRDTFRDTYAGLNTEEDMAKHLSERFSLEVLLSELTDPQSEFYFAEVGSSVAGYIKVNLGGAQTEQVEGKGLELERIYVLPEYKSMGVGRKLFQKTAQIGESYGLDFIWLGVWEKNPAAIAFYQRIGFVPFGKHIFVVGDDEQQDILMKFHLGAERDG